MMPFWCKNKFCNHLDLMMWFAACQGNITLNSTLNPGQNYLRKFSPSCLLSYATKLFPKRRLCEKKTPSPNSMLLPTNAQGSGFLLNTQQHCFQGKGNREERVQLRCLEKCCPSIRFSQQFCPRLLLRISQFKKKFSYFMGKFKTDHRIRTLFSVI